MLERLSIQHYALIDDAEIVFSDGLTVLTGETGAGKSIIMGALSLLLGDKADAQSVRSGCPYASISATFSFDTVPESLATCLEKLGVTLEEGNLIISRIVKATGRSSIQIQGIAQTRQALEELSSHLVDISSQRDHQSLFLSVKQREVLDSYAKDSDELSRYRGHYETLQELNKQKEKLSEILSSSKREADYLSFATDEIEKLHIKKGEDDSVAAEEKILESFEQIHDHLQDAVDSLHGGEDGGLSALDALKDATRNIASASATDTTLSSLASRLDSATIECQDIYETIREHLESMSFSQERLDELQTRSSQLQKMKKKYGPSLDDVLLFLENAKAKLEVGSTSEEQLSHLDKQIAGETEEVRKAAASLTQTRKKSALKLSRAIESVLHGLGMAQAVFTIAVTDVPYGPSGADEVSFAICANPGLESRAISDVASGGELSRILLSLKAVLDQDDPVGTLVFDEVDSGIGGKVALAVGDELRHLKSGHQVLAITHLASIAAMADHHLLVEKRVVDGKTYSSITTLSGDKRVEEIARMLSGDTSAVSLAHARQLLQN